MNVERYFLATVLLVLITVFSFVNGKPAVLNDYFIILTLPNQNQLGGQTVGRRSICSSRSRGRPSGNNYFIILTHIINHTITLLLLLLQKQQKQ